MGNSDRNRLCWCGSGVKYKKCHLNRDAQPRRSIWELGAAHRKLHTVQTCLHPSASTTTCAGGIIRAHTVRRSADLKAIARRGHVYQADGDVTALHKTKGRIVPKLVGINEASTFWGFCHSHDNSTFLPLEQRTFIPDREQAFLLAYRPLAKELYLKLRQSEAMGIARESDRGRPEYTQILMQSIVSAMLVGISKSIEDLRYHKQNFDRDLLAGDYSKMRFVAIHLERAPDVMCSGVVQPHYDFGGRKIQEITDLSTTLQFVSFSLIATDGGGAAVFAWRQDSDEACSALVDSLLSLPRDEIPDALLRFAFSEFENSFYAPEWWENLPPTAKDALSARIHHGVYPGDRISPGYLTDDGIRAANWKVTRVEESRS